MGIRFSVDPEDQRYFVTHIEGVVTDAELLAAYRSFLTGPDWTPGMHELGDLSAADLSRITPEGLRELSLEMERLIERAGGAAYRTAVFAPSDLPYGLARMYGVYSEESGETVQVFRDLERAKRWLTTEGESLSDGG